MSECKTAWKYLKGSEKDFEGAPAWSMQVLKECGTENIGYDENVNGKQKVGDRLYWPDLHEAVENAYRLTSDDVDSLSNVEIIAQREPITNVTVNISTPCGEDDLNECIGQHHCREKVGELHIDGKVHAVNLGDGEIMSLIAERGARYGKFKDGAEIMRDLKHVMYEVDGWNNLTPSQKEALDMIQHKIGRILNGDPNYDDNWKDIAGYAKLIADELNGDIK